MPDYETIIKGNRALNAHHGSRGTLSQYRGGKAFSLFLQSIRSSGILLDVGCAEGFFLLGVEENSSWKAEGIDILDNVVTFARKRLGLTVHLGTLEDLAEQAGRYDYIRMNNVIEHVQDPVRFLNTACALLKKGGRVYCSTPNGFQDGYVLKTANKRGFKKNLIENHFFYYHPRTLAKLFKACGFSVRKAYCEDISHSLSNFGLLPGFRRHSHEQHLRLNSIESKENAVLKISDDKIKSFKYDPSVRVSRLKWEQLRRRLFRLRFPASLPIGHQQNMFAEKM
jgi:SAM-dependent methyltransferase